MRLIDSPPTTAEIEEQLMRMLQSPRFANAPNPSAFLSLVVRRALKGKRTTARQVGDALFKDKIEGPDSSDVRVTASNLRKTVDRYYEIEGSNDAVIISFPKPPKDKSVKLKEGEAYWPSFYYNKMHPLTMAMKLGNVCLEEGTVRSLNRASKIFSLYSDAYPDSVGPLIGLIETGATLAANGYGQISSDDPSNGRKILQMIEDQGQHYWRFWAASAFLALTSDDFDLAKTHFEKALYINAAAVEGYPGYITYLTATGCKDKALGLVTRYLGEHVEEPAVRPLAARLLLQMGQFRQAITMLVDAIDVNRGDCAAHEQLARVALHLQEPDSIDEHMAFVRALFDFHSYTETVLALRRIEQTVYPTSTAVADALREDAEIFALPVTWVQRPDESKLSPEREYLLHVYKMAMGEDETDTETA